MTSVEHGPKARVRRDAAVAAKVLAYLLKPANPNAQVVLDYGAVHGLACTRVDPEWFFNATHDPDRQQKVEAARRLCAPCPVRDACLAWAVEEHEDGLWAGTTATERRAMRGDH